MTKLETGRLACPDQSCKKENAQRELLHYGVPGTRYWYGMIDDPRYKSRMR